DEPHGAEQHQPIPRSGKGEGARYPRGRVSPMLRVERLTKRFGGLVAVNNVSFTVAKGSVMAILGPNGAGKTTTFNLITGIDAPDAGEVWFDGRRVTRYAPHRLAAIGKRRTVPNIRAFPHPNALEKVIIRRTGHPHPGVLG